jgi:V-type H+-transporting ATPase subunit a
MNSMKMKIAVIIGVVHMTSGVLLKASNAIFFRNWLDFFFEFVPQLAFLVLLFGYMDFLIIYKWNVDWGLYSNSAPSIITTMINIPLGLGKTVHL